MRLFRAFWLMERNARNTSQMEMARPKCRRMRFAGISFMARCQVQLEWLVTYPDALSAAQLAHLSLIR